MNHEATPYSLEIKFSENELFEEVESSNELQIDTESSEVMTNFNIFVIMKFAFSSTFSILILYNISENTY